MPAPNPTSLIPGIPVALAPRVRRVVAPNAGLMTGPGTNTYLLGDTDVAVLDPGPDDPAHLDALLRAAPGGFRWVVVTHTHRDHSPLAAVLARRTGARLIGLPPPHDGRQDMSFAPDDSPDDGKHLRLGEVTLVAIHTPGHASNCVCYLMPSTGLLFTGDHVLEGVSPVILPPDGSMTAYFHSLAKLESQDFERIAPGHGAVMERGKHVVQLLRAHRLSRENKILATLAGLGPVSLDALTAAVYDDVASDRHSLARLTLEAHLIKLEREERVLEQAGCWRLASG